MAHQGEDEDHDHVEEEGCTHGECDVPVLCTNDRGNGCDGRATADSGAGTDQVAHLPVEMQSLAHTVADTETVCQGKEHDHERPSPDLHDGRDVQAGPQQYDGNLEQAF